MSRKRTAAFTAAAFILFTVSCAYQKIRDTSIETVVSKYPRAQILGVQTAQNEYFDFAKTPGRLRGTEVTGEAWHRVEFDPADVTTSKTDKDGRPVQVKTKDGKELKVLESSDGKLVCSVYGPVTIPVSEVRLAHIRTINTGLAIVGGVVAAGAIAGLIVAASKPRHPAPSPDSCPYIYSFDGAEYVFDAEPYGAAVCEGLTRTEWASLDHLAPVGGRYKVLVANELEETQYTDELKLIAVDHPLGTAAVPDTTGRFHTIARPLPPIGARDGKGRDILPLVDRNDKLFWVSTVEGREPGAEDDLRDELVFEFPKPAGATRVKLMANAWTTMWGSMVAKKFLEVRGRSLPDWYAEVNSHGRGLNCHILTNGVRILEDRDGGFLAGLIRAGLDKVFVHIDSGQRHVHGDVEAARRATGSRRRGCPSRSR